MLGKASSESMQEYCALRDELATKRDKLASTHWGILSLVIAILAFGISLNDQNFVVDNMPYAWLNEFFNVVFLLVEIAVFSVPVVILYVVSVKISRDYRQVLMLSIYLQVFYEFPKSKDNGQTSEWEHTRQQLLLEKEHPEKAMQKALSFVNKKTLNMECYALTYVVNLMHEMFVILRVFEYHSGNISAISYFYMAIYILIPTLLLIFLPTMVWHNTSISKLNAKYGEYYKNSIVDKAVKKGIIEGEEKEECIKYVLIENVI